MRSRRARLQIVVLCAVISACGGGMAPEDRDALCDAVTDVMAGRGLVERALLAEQAGDDAAAVDLARQAAGAAAAGHDHLQRITTDEVRRGPAWQGLLRVYLSIGQAANALLPEFEQGGPMAVEQLQLASSALESTRPSLPPGCGPASAEPG